MNPFKNVPSVGSCVLIPAQWLTRARAPCVLFRLGCMSPRAEEIKVEAPRWRHLPNEMSFALTVPLHKPPRCLNKKTSRREDSGRFYKGCESFEETRVRKSERCHVWRWVISLRVYCFRQRRLSCNITVESITQKHSGSRLLENDALCIQNRDGFNQMTRCKLSIKKYALLFYGQQDRLRVAFTTY